MPRRQLKACRLRSLAGRQQEVRHHLLGRYQTKQLQRRLSGLESVKSLIDEWRRETPLQLKQQRLL